MLKKKKEKSTAIKQNLTQPKIDHHQSHSRKSFKHTESYHVHGTGNRKIEAVESCFVFDNSLVSLHCIQRKVNAIGWSCNQIQILTSYCLQSGLKNAIETLTH